MDIDSPRPESPPTLRPSPPVTAPAASSISGPSHHSSAAASPAAGSPSTTATAPAAAAPVTSHQEDVPMPNGDSSMTPDANPTSSATASASGANGTTSINGANDPTPTASANGDRNGNVEPMEHLASDSSTRGARDEADQEHDGTSTASSGASIGPPSAASNGASAAEPHVAGPDDTPHDLDRFLQRVEMEKRLPSPKPPQRPQVVTGRGGYDPPSPSRPWQLADVLWQPLPQPGGARVSPQRSTSYPSSHGPSHSLPSLAALGHGSRPVGSSRKRPGMDDYLGRPSLSPLRMPHGRGGGNSSGGNHRRASSSISSLQFLTNDPYPSSPLRPKKQPKKRSQSHSNLRDRPSTQDVDAAKALTFMFESGRSPHSPTVERLGPDPSGPPVLPPLQTHFHPHPPPPPMFSPDMPPPRPRAQSFATDHYTQRPILPPPLPPGPRPLSSHSRGGHARHTGSIDSSAAFRSHSWASDRDRRERERERDRVMNNGGDDEMAGRGEEEKNAAELMMFLAHSPSAGRKRSAADGPPPSFGSTARVLFSDNDRSAPPPLRRFDGPLPARN